LNYLGFDCFDFVLKGRGFQPRHKCHKINPALAAEGVLSLQCHFSRTLAAPFKKLRAARFRKPIASDVMSKTCVSLPGRSLCNRNGSALD
jgi:hypothetical protein